jgi:hypothetical protein
MRTWGLGLALGLALAPAAARAQMRGAGRPLGGYGAATIGSSYRGGGGGTLLPYGGGFGGFVPYRGLEPRPPSMATAPGPARATPIGGASMVMRPLADDPGAMARGYAPFAAGGRMGGPIAPPFRAGAGRPMAGPGFGYPFRQPPRPGGSGGPAGMGSM